MLTRLLGRGLWLSIGSVVPLLACGELSSPRTHGLLSVSPDTIQASRSATPGIEWVDLRFTVTIRNNRGTDVELSRCGGVLERLEGEEWKQVWEPVCPCGQSVARFEGDEEKVACALVLLAPDVLQAGKTRTYEQLASAALAGNGKPKWMGSVISGQYRYVYPVAVRAQFGETKHSEQWYSNTFTVVDATEE